MNTPAGIHKAGWTACAAMTRREAVRFARQPTRVAAGIGTPALFGVFIAGGLGGSFMAGTEDAGYGAFALPGVATMVAMFASIFSAMSLIEDRNAGLLQSALVSPTPAWAIAASKAMAGSATAAAQAAAILLIAAPFVDAATNATGAILALGAVACAATGLTGLGLAAAWKTDSTAGFHGVMSMVLMPMWLLSGGFFDAGKAAPWMRVLTACNPLRWCTDAMRAGLLENNAPVIPWVGSIAFAAGTLGAAGWVIKKGRDGP